MQRTARVLGLVLASLLSTSCLSRSGIPGPIPKVVIEKVAANRLVARDGTWCTVDPERWEQVDIGDTVWCLWRDDAPPASAGMPIAVSRLRSRGVASGSCGWREGGLGWVE